MDNFKDFLFNILLSNQPSLLIKKNEDYIFKMIPELQKCKGFNQNNPWHIYDVYEHILHVIDRVSANIEVRLAALFHDIGKPFTYTEDEKGIRHFYNHWNKSKDIFLQFAIKNNLDKKMINTVSKLIYYHDINIATLNLENLKYLIEEFNSNEIEMLFELKESDLLAQSSKFHNLLLEYKKQKDKLLKLKNDSNSRN